jgi:hypothetical protein
MTTQMSKIDLMKIVLENVTRLEVIDEPGRTYTRWNCVVEPSVQDEGRTLKLFVSKK